MSTAQRGLLFDLFGVIMNEQDDAGRASIEKASGLSGDDLWPYYEQFREDYDAGRLDSVSYWEAISKASGHTITDVQACIDADLQSWSGYDAEMADYVHSLIGRVPVGLISNAVAEEPAYIHSLFDWFSDLDPLIFSCEVGMAKPHADIYALAIERIGLEPSNILFIDDREVNIEGARSVGLNVHLFRGIEGLREEIERFLS